LHQKVAGYKINLQKSVAFLYTNDEQIEKEYKKTIPLTVASKKSNTGINVTKDVKTSTRKTINQFRKKKEYRRWKDAHGLVE
jgi:hypothetical protein